jgi:hypothetical protein
MSTQLFTFKTNKYLKKQPKRLASLAFPLNALVCVVESARTKARFSYQGQSALAAPWMVSGQTRLAGVPIALASRGVRRGLGLCWCQGR